MTTDPTPENGWRWWFGTSNEIYTHSFATEAECRAYAADYGYGYICEAKQEPQRLADWIGDADELLDRADDALCDNDMAGDDRLFDVTPEQKADLGASVRAAIDAWQDRHALVFRPFMFTDSRNEERITQKDAADD